MSQKREARELLESSRIVWARDYDAVLIGFVVGVLAALAVGRLW